MQSQSLTINITQWSELGKDSLYVEYYCNTALVKTNTFLYVKHFLMALPVMQLCKNLHDRLSHMTPSSDLPQMCTLR